MSDRLVARPPAHRSSSRYGDHYETMLSISKGVVLAVAAVSLMQIVGSSEQTGPKLAALAFWAASLGNVVSSYVGLITNTILITAEPNALDLLVPFAFGLLEFAEFAILVPLTAGPLGAEPSAAAQLDHITWWLLVAVLLGVVAEVNFANVRVQLARTATVAPPELASLVAWCQANVRMAAITTAVGSTFALGAFVVVRTGFPQVWVLGRLPDAATLRHWQGPLAVVFCLGCGPALVMLERARRVVVAIVSGEATAEDTRATT